MAFNEKLFWHKRTEFIREMINLARRISRSFKANISERMPDGNGALANKKSYRTRKRYGEIVRLGWSTFRYGLLREQGFNKTITFHTRRQRGAEPNAEKNIKVRSHTRSLAPQPN